MTALIEIIIAIIMLPFRLIEAAVEASSIILGLFLFLISIMPIVAIVSMMLFSR